MPRTRATSQQVVYQWCTKSPGFGVTGGEVMPGGGRAGPEGQNMARATQVVGGHGQWERTVAERLVGHVCAGDAGVAMVAAMEYTTGMQVVGTQSQGGCRLGPGDMQKRRLCRVVSWENRVVGEDERLARHGCSERIPEADR